MIKIKLDIWIDDSNSKMKLPSDDRLCEAMQIFAKKKKDKQRLDELSKKLIGTLDEMNKVLCRMDID